MGSCFISVCASANLPEFSLLVVGLLALPGVLVLEVFAFFVALVVLPGVLVLEVFALVAVVVDFLLALQEVSSQADLGLYKGIYFR